MRDSNGLGGGKANVYVYVSMLWTLGRMLLERLVNGRGLATTFGLGDGTLYIYACLTCCLLSSNVSFVSWLEYRWVEYHI